MTGTGCDPRDSSTPEMPFCAASGHLGTMVMRWWSALALGATGTVSATNQDPI